VSLINDPKHWRDRAKEARAIADEMKDPDAKQMMLGIARDYVRLEPKRGQRVRHNQSSPLPARRLCVNEQPEEIIKPKSQPTEIQTEA
jgi:hypothetical protein